MFEKNKIKISTTTKLKTLPPNKNLKIQDDILLWEHYVQQRLKFVLYA